MADPSQTLENPEGWRHICVGALKTHQGTPCVLVVLFQDNQLSTLLSRILLVTWNLRKDLKEILSIFFCEFFLTNSSDQLLTFLFRKVAYFRIKNFEQSGAVKPIYGATFDIDSFSSVFKLQQLLAPAACSNISRPVILAYFGLHHLSASRGYMMYSSTTLTLTTSIHANLFLAVEKVGPPHGILIPREPSNTTSYTEPGI